MRPRVYGRVSVLKISISSTKARRYRAQKLRQEIFWNIFFPSNLFYIYTVPTVFVQSEEETYNITLKNCLPAYLTLADCTYISKLQGTIKQVPRDPMFNLDDQYVNNSI